MKIAFHSNQLIDGGVEVAMFDYAFYNQTILGNESIIISRNLPTNVPAIIEKYKAHFKVILYDDFSDVDKILLENKVDVFYTIKSGEYDGILCSVTKNCVHSVFMANEPHGEVYAYISEWLANKMNNKMPYVPHMINLPDGDDDLRDSLHIPKDAYVVGRYGSYNTFDIPFAQEAVINSLNQRNDLYYLFACTKKFYEHERIIYLDSIIDLNEKVKFINTCNSMLHARARGETFGLACGEFSIKNKPVITYKLSPEQCHIDILKNKGIYYENYEELMKLLINIQTDNLNYDAYSELYSPIPVMEKFKTIFLK